MAVTARLILVFALAATGAGACRTLPEPVPPLTRTPDDEFRARPPVTPVGPGPLLVVPAIQSFSLSNQMQVLVIERPDLPFAAIAYANAAAHDGDTENSDGLAALVARMIVPFPEDGAGNSQDDELEPHPKIGPFGTAVEVVTSPERLASALQKVARLVRQPTLDAHAFDAARALQRTFLDDGAHKVSAQLLRAARAVLYGTNNALVISPAKRQAILSQYSLDSARTFHAQRYGPTQSAVVVVGDVKAPQVVDAARAAFGDWTPTAATTAVADLEFPPVQLHPGRLMIRGIDRSLDQAIVQIVMPCAGLSDPDDAVFDVIAEMLGGGLTSRMLLVSRHSTGNTYSVDAQCRELQKSGEFTMTFDTKPEAAGQALEYILVELGRLQRATVARAEVDNAVRDFLGGMAERLTTNQGMAHFIADAFLFRTGLARLARMEAQYRAITPEDVLRVARRFRIGATGIAVAGKPAVLNPALARLADVVWISD